MKDFEITTHAKCILAGEHAVLRHHPALVLPFFGKTFTLQFYPTSRAMRVLTTKQNETKKLKEIFLNLLHHAQSHYASIPSILQGDFVLENHISVGSGIGFSAALCVAFSEWMAKEGWISSDEIFDVAKNLENRFHGKSSGLDIYGVQSEEALFFLDQKIETIPLTWTPHLYLSACPTQGLTKECVSKVNELWEKDKKFAEEIDKEMEFSVELCREALTSQNKTERIYMLAHAMNQAKNCFSKWNLITPEMQAQIDFLMENHALAVKPTGSGGGGYILSLFEKRPDDKMHQTLIPLFQTS